MLMAVYSSRTDLFQISYCDESQIYPRCYRQNISLPQVRPHLTQALLAEFQLKAQEFGTLSPDLYMRDFPARSSCCTPDAESERMLTLLPGGRATQAALR
jgi:hypothetical protein